MWPRTVFLLLLVFVAKHSTWSQDQEQHKVSVAPSIGVLYYLKNRYSSDVFYVLLFNFRFVRFLCLFFPPHSLPLRSLYSHHYYFIYIYIKFFAHMHTTQLKILIEWVERMAWMFDDGFQKSSEGRRGGKRMRSRSWWMLLWKQKERVRDVMMA